MARLLLEAGWNWTRISLLTVAPDASSMAEGRLYPRGALTRSDETWHRLREWTGDQAKSEKLAAQVLIAEGFTDLDPIHPLGGKDGGKDALIRKDGDPWIMAVYFPRGQQSLADIRKKFLHDYAGVQLNAAVGMAFVTNQQLREAERRELREAADGLVEIYHLERVSAVLDRPDMRATRAQFLDIQDVEGLLTGGDTFCHWMLYYFDLDAGVARQWCIIRQGDFPLYNVRIRIRDMDAERELGEEQLGELNAPAYFRSVRWPLRDDVYYRVWFGARNGMWTQDLQLRKSISDDCWFAATRVKGRDGRTVLFERIEDGFGNVEWRP